MPRHRGQTEGRQAPTLTPVIISTDEAAATTALRLNLLANGYSPCANRDKTTRRKGWNEGAVTEALIRSWLPPRRGQTLWPATGLMIENGLTVVDADVPLASLAAAFRLELQRIAPQLFAGGLERGRDDDSPKTAFVVRRKGEPFHLNSGVWVVEGAGDRPVHHQVEIFAQERTLDGKILRQVGCFGPHTVGPGGEVVRRYAWRTASPETVPLADLPELDETTAQAICDAFDRLAETAGLNRQRRGGRIVPRNVYDLTEEMIFENDTFRGNLSDLTALYWASDEDPRISGSFTGEGSGERQDRCHVGWSGPRQGGHITITDYSTEITHRPVMAAPPDLGPALTALQRARERLGLVKPESRNPDLDPEPDLGAAMQEARQGGFSHAATASAVAGLLAGGLRYGHGEERWRLFTGPHWAAEQAAEGRSLIGDLCVAFSAAAANAQKRQSMQSLTYQRAIEGKLAQHPAIATAPAAWDQNGWVLPTLTEVVDLRSGLKRPGSPVELIRRRAGVDMADEARCPRFRDFLDLITGGDKALQRTLQQWAGQGVVGELLEQRLAFFFGAGGNGKGTLISIQKAVLGEFFAAAPKHLFVEGYYEGHPTELVCFEGSRAVFGAEPRVKSTWAAGLIKPVTGGDPLPIRGMHQDFRTIQPVCALTVAGNSQPRFEVVDDSIKRRFFLVPFNFKIGKEDEDTDYPRQIVAAEGPAILRWMVEGLLDWLQTRRLFVAPVIAEATAEYFEDEDAIGEFLRTQCIVETGARIGRRSLFTAWEDQARLQKRPAGAARAFALKVQTLPGVTDGEGYVNQGERFWFGIRLKTVKDFSRDHLKPVT